MDIATLVGLIAAVTTLMVAIGANTPSFFDVTPLLVAVKWPVEATVPKTGRAVRFQTRDISLQGIRLEGDTAEAFQQVLFGDGQAHLQLCLPDREAPLPVRGELKWGMNEAGAFTTGWRFSRLPRRSKKTLKTCIWDHSDDRIQD